MNHPPDIVIPADPVNDLVLIADIEKIDVYARDADDDELFFHWSGVPADVAIPADPPQPLLYDGEVLWLSTYRVPRDVRIDGKVIEVQVWDGVEDAFAEWQITVEEP